MPHHAPAQGAANINDLVVQRLEEAAERALTTLKDLAESLHSTEAIKLWNLVDELKAIESQSCIDEFGTAAGGFHSQIGRLGGIMQKLTELVGVAAKLTAEGSDDAGNCTPILN